MPAPRSTPLASLPVLRGIGCLGIVLAVVSTVGCGPQGPAVEYVEGVVTLDGTPLADADIGFSPATPGQGLAAAGRTNADGTFQLNAQGASPGRGTVAGEYVVTVRKVVAAAGAGPTSTDDPNYGKELPDISGRDAQAKSLVPEVYTDAKTSPLKASVQRGKNTFQFDVKTAP